MTENTQSFGLDEGTKQFCIDRLNEIIEVTNSLGYDTQLSELGDGLPTMFIGVQKNYKNEDTIATLTFLPLEIRNDAYLLLQYSILINLEVPEERKEEMELLIKIINERFLMGTLVLYDNEISLKYCMYVNVDEELDQVSTIRTLDILTIEADDILKKADLLLENKSSLEELAQENTFLD